MTLSRPLRVLASCALVGALWIPTAQLASSGSATRADDEAAEPQPFKPVARVNSIMAGFGAAMGELHGLHDATDAEHRHDRMSTWAGLVAELSNVHTRHRRDADYLAMAAETRRIALELSREARASMADETRITELLGQLDTSCATCHDTL